MTHQCEVIKNASPKGLCKRIRREAQELILVSSENPIRFDYFKSDLAVKTERARHLRINKHAIHPFSKFRSRYEMALILVYAHALVLKPMCAFLSEEHYRSYNLFRTWTILVDAFCWVDILMTFFTGYTKDTDQFNTVELRFGEIAKNYIVSRYFISDVLSSLPQGALYYNEQPDGKTVHVVIDVLMFMKLVRIFSLFTYIYRSAKYLRMESKMVPFFVCVLLTVFLTVHWTACLFYGVPRAVTFFKPHLKNMTWMHFRKIEDKSLFTRYNCAFYKSSACILGIRHTWRHTQLEEEYAMTLVAYFIGKLLVAFVWLILAMAILNARSIRIKFLELMDQLEEYMRRKNLPFNLKDRINQFYYFKYQKKYFQEKLINSLLPEKIKKEVAMHICKSMIKNVALFEDLSKEEMANMVEHLQAEIYLPRDVIIQHGSAGEAMYFISSGTVAVYTHSGKEICHLQDGAYFGEISLLLPNQTTSATIVALETSHVYRLNKRDFEEYLLKNKKILAKVLQSAEEKLQQATELEEAYKKLLFEQTYQVTFDQKG